MKILITGANGLLGQKLVNLLLKQTDVEVIATSKGEDINNYYVPNYQFYSLDITDREQVNFVIQKVTPDVIINTAAFTNVDKCEELPEDCYQVNEVAVRWLLEAAKKQNAFFIQLSTDFVFSGKCGPLSEEDITEPINIYGKAKLQAETWVQLSFVDHAILRTSLVYGLARSMSRSNIVLWVKESLEKGKTIHVVNDQSSSPTLAEDLAMACWLVAKKKAKGLFHISDEQSYTPYQMALMVADHFNLDKSLIQETDSSKFKQKAKRPLITGLKIDKAKTILGFKPHTFAQGLTFLEKQMQELYYAQ